MQDPVCGDWSLENFKYPIRAQGWNDHRGLITYSKYKFKIAQTLIREDFELTHVLFPSSSNPYSIILFYRPSSSKNVTDFIESIQSMVEDPRRENQTMIILGDANIDLNLHNDTITQQYTQGLINLNLKQLITSPTTMFRSTIDHI